MQQAAQFEFQDQERESEVENRACVPGLGRGGSVGRNFPNKTNRAALRAAGGVSRPRGRLKKVKNGL